MSNATYLEIGQVPAHLRTLDGYSGRQFKAVPTETVTVPADAGLWSGGTRDLFFAVRLSDGAAVELPGQDMAPDFQNRRARSVAIPPGFAMVCHSCFCGQDMGLTFYVNPASVAALLPDQTPLEMSPHARTVLRLTREYIPAARRDYAARAGINAAAYDAAKSELIAAGLLNKAGALTTKGKNVAATLEG